MTPDTAEVSVVLPVYRTGGALRELHRRLDAVLGPRLRELVLVDDACPEGSGLVIAELADRDTRVRPITLARNRGQHRAVLAGLRATTGTWSLVMDADLQDPPEAIPPLLDRASAGGVDAVFAGRRGRYESPLRLLTSRLYKRLLGRLVGVPADAGTFVVLSRPLVDKLVEMGGPSPSLVAMIGCAGVVTTSVPVERAPRFEGRSAYSHAARLRSAVQALRWVAWWRLRGVAR
jgi:dolichol-phosphate mannosyltransferase/undecaprenyl-phosphate 4-deoxy-4-formamido-L-arabinose transferase